MSKKRKRESEAVDVSLAGIYESLADENEKKRFDAAEALVTNFEPKSTSLERIKIILTRLFRGLCSSRKAARLGFSVALAEYLSETQTQRGASPDDGLPASSIIDILDNETVPDGNNSGQDERDHYFGRLFGAEAVIKSKILIQQQDLVQWRRLLDLICGIALKKPWLRQECGWILYKCVDKSSSAEHTLPEDFALDIIEKLTSHKLIRTPEGVAIWLGVSETFPGVKLPKHVWKHRDPLAKREISLLANVLKDASTKKPEAEDEYQPQGAATWSAQLHFAWEVVLSKLYKIDPQAENGLSVKPHGEAGHTSVDFETFWLKAVDESLVAPTSSTERKHWGLLLLNSVLTNAPPEFAALVFTKNVMSCFINALKGERGYLQRSAQKAVQGLQSRVKNSSGIAPVCYIGFLRAVNYADFDTITKTKLMDKLIAVPSIEDQSEIAARLLMAFQNPNASDPEEAVTRRKNILALQGKFLTHKLLHKDAESDIEIQESSHSLVLSRKLLCRWVQEAFFESIASEPSVDPATRSHVKGRLATHLEQALKLGPPGRRLLREVIGYIRFREILNREELTHPSVVDFGGEVGSTVEDAWVRLRAIPLNWTPYDEGAVAKMYGSENGDQTSNHKRKKKDSPAANTSRPKAQKRSAGNAFTESIALLYSLVLFQVYNGDAEAVEILEDLIAYHDKLESKSIESDALLTDDQSESVIEILLSFATKSSKFLRRINTQIFEGFAPQVTKSSLQSFIRVLATKEGADGQQEIFDMADDAADDVTNSSSDGESDVSDIELIDSDVEMISVSSKSDSESEESDEDENDAEDGEDAELAAFDAKLAAALGTRKVDHADDDLSTSGASDTDMDDDQMVELDQKLTEVFRARQQANSKKRDKKDAKETVVNFKNRVLDLVDVYLKIEYLGRNSLDLVLPLLVLARETSTKQLADRTCNILNEFCRRCKGDNVPSLGLNSEEEDEEEVMAILRNVQREAGMGASNAHAAAASHASILLVKTLVNGGVAIGDVIQVYGDTRERQLMDKKCKIQAGFFTDWNNWCVSAREKLAS